MSYTIFISNPAALIAQPGRAVNTFPSGLVRVDQTYIGLTSRASTHRATLAVGNNMPDGDSYPCIDGLKIFPEVQERRREDGFTEYIVSAYGRTSTSGVNNSSPWGKIYKFLYIGPWWQKYGNLVNANSGIMFKVKFIFANLNFKQVIPRATLDDILGLESPIDFGISPKIIATPLHAETGLFPDEPDRFYADVPNVAAIDFFPISASASSYIYECKITLSNTLTLQCLPGDNPGGLLNMYAGIPYSIGTFGFDVTLEDSNFEPVSYGEFYECNYSRRISLDSVTLPSHGTLFR